MLQSQSIVGNEEAKQMSELLTQSRNEVLDSFSKVDQAIKALPTNSIERIQIERRAADNRAQAGSFVPQLQEDKTRAERDGHYKGVVANDDVSKAIKTKADNKVRTIAKRNGLDPDKTLARYDSSNAVHASQTTAWREEERKAAVENGIKPEKVDEAHKEISSVYNSARRNIRQHDDNKRQIIDNARQIKSATDRDQIETLNNDQYTRIKDALTQSQLQRLERGDASQLSNITSDAVTQKALTRDYLDTAAKHAETPERQAQLEQSRTRVDRQLQDSLDLQRKQQQQQQRTRNNGIER